MPKFNLCLRWPNTRLTRIRLTKSLSIFSAVPPHLVHKRPSTPATLKSSTLSSPGPSLSHPEKLPWSKSRCNSALQVLDNQLVSSAAAILDGSKITTILCGNYLLTVFGVPTIVNGHLPSHAAGVSTPSFGANVLASVLIDHMLKVLLGSCVIIILLFLGTRF